MHKILRVTKFFKNEGKNVQCLDIMKKIGDIEINIFYRHNEVYPPGIIVGKIQEDE